MTASNRFDCEMRVALPASLQAVEEFFREFHRRSRALRKRGNCFAAELLLREALTNAVIHGSHADPSKQVHLSLRLRNRRLLMHIEDEGEGFDWRTAGQASPGLAEPSGRGIQILYRYANRVRFNRKGNAVTMIKQV